MEVIDSKFDIGEKVFVVGDEEKEMKFVVALIVRKNNVTYEIRSFDGMISEFEDFELEKYELKDIN